MSLTVYVYSETNADNVRNQLGKAEYSYYFVRAKFLPALERIARVVEVADPADAKPVDGSRAVLFFFGPPQRAPASSPVPLVIVLAWEFSSIPTVRGPQDQSVEDWRPALARAWRVITLSTLAADAVREALPGLPVHTIASPIALLNGWRARIAGRFGRWTGVRHRKTIRIRGDIHDSRACRITHEVVERFDRREISGTPAWDGAASEWSFRRENPRVVPALIGFYDADVWGAWSRIAAPWVELPWRVDRPCRVRLTVRGIGANVGREIGVELGGHSHRIRLGEGFDTVWLDFNPVEDAFCLRFSGIDASHVASASDPRTLGLGLASIRIESAGSVAARESTPSAMQVAQRELRLDGVVFSSVFNPEDGRKNWEDMVTAFCWAFRDREDVTLLLKMSHRNPATFYGRLMVLWSRLHPFRCRVVALHGFLDESEYAALVDASSYVVNSAFCEGQCLPLMEFMRAGVPAVAPDHSAMRDYVNPGNTFVVRSAREPASWPEDESHALRTFRWRIDWDALRQAFLEADACARECPAHYRRLSRAAARDIARDFSVEPTVDALRRALDGD